MTIKGHRRVQRVAATVAGGGVAILLIGLVFIAATAVQATSVAERNTAALRVQLEAVRDSQVLADARSKEASADRDRLAAQNKALQRQIKSLTDYLRANGIPVPATPTTSGTTSGGRASPPSARPPASTSPAPKPRPTTAAPKPTAPPRPTPAPMPKPRPVVPSLTCSALGLLCG